MFSRYSSISISSDDAEQTILTGFMKLTSSDLELVTDQETQIVGLRFQNLSIPQNAQIISATLQFTVDEKTNTNPCILDIYGELNPGPLTFTTANNNIGARPRTQSTFAWKPIDWTSTGAASFGEQTSNILSIVQEVVNQATYSSTSAIIFKPEY